MLETFTHFIKHFIGLCGEPHPSVIITGAALLTYSKQIINQIKSIVYNNATS